MHLALFPQPALAKLRLDQECDLERRGRALVRHAGDADDDPTTGERVESAAELECGFSRVEVVRLRVEMLDLLRHDARPGGEDEIVVDDRQAIGQKHALGALIDPIHVADDERDELVQEASLRSLEAIRSFAAHGDVHEARLVCVLAGLVDDRDRYVAGLDLAAELLDQ